MVKETKYYEILGLQSTATDVDIKKSYRLMALRWHPDKNNNEEAKEANEMFQKITSAYQILSNPHHRAIYDKYGELGLTGEIGPEQGFDQELFNNNNNNNINHQSTHNKGSDYSTPVYNNPKYNSSAQVFSTTTSTSFGTRLHHQQQQQQQQQFESLHSGFPNFPPSSSSLPASSYSNYNPYNSTFPPKANDLFNQFFGDLNENINSNTNQSYQLSKSPSIKNSLSCSLDDLYNGKASRLVLSRRIICTTCHCSGGVLSRCPQCNGGKVTIQNNIGSFKQRFEIMCQNCNGTSQIVSNGCPKCKGMKFVKEKKILSLFVHPGTYNEEEIVFENEGDQGINVVPGDVVVKIQETPHEFFQRRGDNLYCNVNIPLIKSLTGGHIYINHLNQSKLKIELGEVIKPNSEKVLKGYGMPIKNTKKFGDLIIKFEIEFPDMVNSNDYAKLTEILPKNLETNNENVPSILVNYIKENIKKRKWNFNINDNSNDITIINDNNKDDNNTNTTDNNNNDEK
ncbi:hypothetical protein WICMUC_001703 [Wickerhamomyces mucosus]|uniref:J domain-containing protein n=1 Tax=Wickerhamomyces mucosus TaxID=1378264 RepID=A0A9P8TGC4_9ASCO|nr:hypothetical protein WICMUC_001703 [Wickerhamomyces mucosus]